MPKFKAGDTIISADSHYKNLKSNVYYTIEKIDYTHYGPRNRLAYFIPDGVGGYIGGGIYCDYLDKRTFSLIYSPSKKTASKEISCLINLIEAIDNMEHIEENLEIARKLVAEYGY